MPSGSMMPFRIGQVLALDTTPILSSNFFISYLPPKLPQKIATRPLRIQQARRIDFFQFQSPRRQALLMGVLKIGLQHLSVELDAVARERLAQCLVGFAREQTGLQVITHVSHALFVSQLGG